MTKTNPDQSGSPKRKAAKKKTSKKKAAAKKAPAGPKASKKRTAKASAKKATASAREDAAEVEVEVDEELPEKVTAEEAESVEVLDPEVVLDDEDGGGEGDKAAGDAVDAALDVSADYSVAVRDSLSAYLADIRRYPVLSREEEHELAVRYLEQGDTDAAYRLVTSNLRLVVMIAREYQRAFHNLLDLVQEGNVGLLEAVKQFDPYRGVRFPSYAVWWVRAYIIRHVMNNFRMVKLGTTQAQRRLFFNLQKEKARLEAQGFSPTPELIAENLGVKPKEVIEMNARMGAGAEVSVDAPVSTEGDAKMLDLIPYDGEPVEQTVSDSEFFGLMTEKLGEFRETLEGRDLEIVNERLLSDDPVTLQELGDRWGVSRERVRQIEEALKKRLREFLVEQVRLDGAELFDE